MGEQLGLSLHGGKPLLPGVPLLGFLCSPLYLEGQYRGRKARIAQEWRSQGNNRVQYTVVSLEMAPEAKVDFSMYRKGFFERFGTFLGMQDVKTGDEEFDSMVVVKSNPPEFAQAALLPELRERLEELYKHLKGNGRMQTKNGSVRYDEMGALHKKKLTARLPLVLDLLADMAAAIDVWEGR